MSLVSVFEPASITARVGVGRLTTVVRTVSAQSLEAADALGRPDSGRNRYTCRAGVRSATVDLMRAPEVWRAAVGDDCGAQIGACERLDGLGEPGRIRFDLTRRPDRSSGPQSSSLWRRRWRAQAPAPRPRSARRSGPCLCHIQPDGSGGGASAKVRARPATTADGRR